MPNNAIPNIPIKEYEVTVQGLEQFVHDLTAAGVSRGLLQSTFNYLVVSYRKAGANDRKKKDKSKPSANSKKEKDVKEGTKTSKKNTDKISGLVKLAEMTGNAVSIKDYAEYKGKAFDQQRKVLEAAWESLLENTPEETRSDKIRAILHLAGLTEDEVKASRAYFPKAQSMTEPGNGNRA